MSFVIEINGVDKTYPGGKEALRGINISVNEGEVIGLVGPNGAGKTTLMKLLLGVSNPTSGYLKVWGETCTSMSKKSRSKIGFVLDQRGLYSDLTVEENLIFWAKLYAVGSKKVEEYLKDWGLGDVRKQPVNQLSSGMMQRLSLVRPLLHDPTLLLLDEPTSQLDPVARVNVIDLINKLKSENKTLIMTSHDLVGLERTCTRILLLQKGRILADGSMQELSSRLGVGDRITIRYRREISKDLLKKIYADYPVQAAGVNTITVSGDGIDSGKLVRMLVEHGIDVENVEEQKQSLEDIYLSIVQKDEGKWN